MAAPKAHSAVTVDLKGPVTSLKCLDLECAVPSVTLAQWTRTLEPVEKIVMPASLQVGARNETMAMIPMQALKLCVAPAHIVCVFDEPLDSCALRLSESVKETARLVQGADKDALLEEWNDCLPLLGMLSATVWIRDPMSEGRGVWMAALDTWQDGNASWPL